MESSSADFARWSDTSLGRVMSQEETHRYTVCTAIGGRFLCNMVCYRPWFQRHAKPHCHESHCDSPLVMKPAPIAFDFTRKPSIFNIDLAHTTMIASPPPSAIANKRLNGRSSHVRKWRGIHSSESPATLMVNQSSRCEAVVNQRIDGCSRRLIQDPARMQSAWIMRSVRGFRRAGHAHQEYVSSGCGYTSHAVPSCLRQRAR